MKLNIIQQRGLWWGISTVLVLISLGAMAISWQQFGAPLKPGLDFAGGTRLQLTRTCVITDSCTAALDVAEVRQVLASRWPLREPLRMRLLVSFAGIVAYLSLRFKLDYAVLAIVALAHDVIITAGLFAILGLVLGVEVDSLFIVALLTVVGFSVNDTVVIYDRVRENLKLSPGSHINDIVDSAVNQTLSRSINTSLSTVLHLVAIFIFGGQTLKYFALALIVGFIAGSYSSIFVASSLLALWRDRTGQAYSGEATPDDPAPEKSG